MRKHLLLIVSIILMMGSITFLVIGIKEDNNTAALKVSSVLALIVCVLSVVRETIRLKNVWKNRKS